MKGNVLKGLVSAFVLIGFLFIFYTPAFSDDKVYTFRMSNWYPPASSFNTSIWPFWQKQLEKASNGRIKIKVFPAEQLVKAADTWEATVQGICDIGHGFLMFEAGRFPISEYGFLPMLFPSNRVASMTMTAIYQKYPQIQEEFKEVKLLWFNANGPAQIFTRKKPVEKLSDLKGQKLHGGGLYFKQVAEQLDFAPITFPFPEVYDALAKGTVDGNSLEWEGQWIWKFYEQTPYALDGINLYVYPFFLFMNKKKWESLPEDIKAIFEAYSGLKGAEMCGSLFDENDRAGKDFIENYYKKNGKPGIVVISKEEKQAWINALKPVRDGWIANMEKKGVPGNEILQDVEKLVDVFSKGPRPWFYKEKELTKDALKK